MKIEAGNTIFYKALDGKFTVYRVEGIKNGSPTEYKLALMNSNGGVTQKSRRFDTTLLDKTGSPRLIRIWLQLGDAVTIVNSKGAIEGKGVVTNFIHPKESTDLSKDLLAEVVTTDSRSFLLSLAEASQMLELE